MSQNVGANCPRARKCLRGTGCCNPYRKSGLDRSGIDPDFNCLAASALDGNRLALPQLLQNFQIAIQQLLSAFITLRKKRKVVSMPPRSHGYSYPPLRQVVHHSPLFGDTDWIVERQDHTPCAYADPVSDRGKRSAGY